MNQLPLDDTTNDETINQLIALYIPLAEEYCHRTFAEPLPSGVKKFVADCIKYSSNGNIASRSMGTVSYSFVTDIPSSMYKPLRPLRKLAW